jgi:nucleoside-diphosphate-sugar epimerase
MRIFLTGGTGYIGGAVASALVTRNHEVVALARSGSETGRLRQLGVTLISGDLASLPQLAEDGALDGFDAFVHAAQAAQDAAALNRIAIDTFLARNAYVLYTSGVWVLGNGAADEDTPVRPLPIVAWRPAQEQLVLSAGHGVIRPGCVYGGKQSLLAPWFAAAEQNQPLQIAGDGNNHWAMVNLHDLADCYVRIVESRGRGTFHAVDDTQATLNECARAVAPNGTIEHVTPNPGPFTDALLVDQEISSQKTRQRLGWIPKRDFVSSVSEQWDEWRAANRG